jgi:hypothetical protein
MATACQGLSSSHKSKSHLVSFFDGHLVLLFSGAASQRGYPSSIAWSNRVTRTVTGQLRYAYDYANADARGCGGQYRRPREQEKIHSDLCTRRWKLFLY